MKRTFITTMPDHIGAFLKASKCLASLGINITRVSYNKAVDSHTLFIDAEGSPEQLDEADRQLTQIGYLQGNSTQKSIVLLEFRLRDVPGSVTDVLNLISQYHFNISYISSQENGSAYQYFKMGLFVEDYDKVARFIRDAEELCRVRVIDYNHSEKVFDNSIFYNSFVNALVKTMGLSDSVRNDLLVNANLAMQTLDEQGLSPYKTFDSISRFADLLAKSRGEHFSPRISHHTITDQTSITIIEPPCGSNTFIIRSNDQYLFIDSGYAVYRNEMEQIFRSLIPDFEDIQRRILITHADVDHCGLLPMFDEILTSHRSKECLRLEYEGLDGFREQNPLHKPYINMCKTLTMYRPVSSSRVTGLWGTEQPPTEPLTYIGTFDFEELHFDVYEGQGGHLPGEVVLIDRQHRLVFTGDVFINVHGLTAEQAEYNQFAPILMTSVDTDPKLCAQQRKAILQLLGDGEWQIFGSHGSKKNIE